MDAAAAIERPGALDRFLRLFTEVRAGEGLTAVLLAFDVFVLLTAYYIVKPVREALILSGGGAEVKSYAAAGQAILLLGAVPLYASLASRFPRRRLIRIVTLFFGACLVAFYLLARAKVPLGVVFFLWVGIFNLMVVAQFWSFANDIYTRQEGERLFPILAFGASAGAVCGSFITGRLIGSLGVYQLLLLAAALLVSTLILTNAIDGREGRRALRRPGATVAEAPLGKEGAFGLVIGNRYLLLIAFLMLVLNWVNTTGEYILGRTVSRAAEAAFAASPGAVEKQLFTGTFIGRFYADFFSVVNLVGLVLQLFFVSRILKYLGVRVAILLLPLIAVGGYMLLAFYPVLSAVRWAKTAENATDYSLQNTVRNVLFLPTTREQKYKAKQAIDTFFWRAGDVLSAGLVFVGTTWLAFGTRQFALVNLALAGVWAAIAVLIGNEYTKRTTAAS
jgi:AAA family ATP:ADP antiporter